MAEKYLKAYLLHCTGDIEKIHDLKRLVMLCVPYAPDIEVSLKEVALVLDPYYVGTRYVADIPLATFTWDMAQEAHASALTVKEFVVFRLRN